MGTKLYVANLPSAPSALALRAHFSVCGVVADVQIVPDRNGSRAGGSAFVRMTSAVGAERALAELNGALFGGQLLLIEAAPDDAADRSRNGADRGREGANRTRDGADRGRPSKGRDEQSDDSPGTRMTSQYRGPGNMTYELDCSGTTLVIRLFFPNEASEWRIVVQPSRDADAPSIAAVAASRAEAFRSVVTACREGTDFARVDWDAVEKSMLKVRAL